MKLVVFLLLLVTAVAQQDLPKSVNVDASKGETAPVPDPPLKVNNNGVPTAVIYLWTPELGEFAQFSATWESNVNEHKLTNQIATARHLFPVTLQEDLIVYVKARITVPAPNPNTPDPIIQILLVRNPPAGPFNLGTLEPCPVVGVPEARKVTIFLTDRSTVTQFNCRCEQGCHIRNAELGETLITIASIQQFNKQITFRGVQVVLAAPAAAAAYTVNVLPVGTLPKIELIYAALIFSSDAAFTFGPSAFTIFTNDYSSKVVLRSAGAGVFNILANTKVIIGARLEVNNVNVVVAGALEIAGRYGSTSLSGSAASITTNGAGTFTMTDPALALNLASKINVENVLANPAGPPLTLDLNGGASLGGMTFPVGLISVRDASIRGPVILVASRLELCDAAIGAAGTAITLNTGSVLWIDTQCKYIGIPNVPAAVDPHPLTNAATAVNLNFNITSTTVGGGIVQASAGEVLVFDQVNRESKFFNIEGNLALLELPVVYIATGFVPIFPGESILLARYIPAVLPNPNGCQPPANPNPNFKDPFNCPKDRKCSLVFQPEGPILTATRCLIYLSISPPLKANATFFSPATFVNLDQDCATYGRLQFEVTAMHILGWIPTSAPFLQVTDIFCGTKTLTVLFKCGSSASVNDAVVQCANAKAMMERYGSDLFVALATTRPRFDTDDNHSNNAVFALFTLVALPLICVLGCVFCYKSKQKEADNQYLQDTATFANVAVAQPAAPVYAYDPVKQW